MKYQLIIVTGDPDPTGMVWLCGREECPWWSYMDKEHENTMCTLFGSYLKDGKRCMDCKLATFSEHKGINPCL